MMGSRGWHRVSDGLAQVEPAHTVVVPHWLGQDPGKVPNLEGIAFWMAEVPVTQGQFDLWKADSGPGGYRAWFQQHKDSLGLINEQSYLFGDPMRFPNRVHHPAEKVDLREALAFGEWLTQHAEVRKALRALGAAFPPGPRQQFSISLPSEVLWEYACRAGTDMDYWSGDGEAALNEVGWYGEQWGTGSTHPVAKKPANPWGLFDLHGNVWEWCLDLYDAGAYAKRVPGSSVVVPQADWRGLDRSAPRVIRGGSWDIGPSACRSAHRFGWLPRYAHGRLGFRLCLLPGLGATF